MEPVEIQAKAVIAAALITSRSVEVPAIPTRGDWAGDAAGQRLRDLTDYVFQLLTASRSEPS